MRLARLLILFGIAISCTTEIEIDIPQEQPKLVVQSTLVPFTIAAPKLLNVKLQTSQQISDTSTTVINDATIYYSENGIIIDTLEYSAKMNDYTITKSISDYPNVGNRYSIEIHKDGYETVNATTTIPSRVTIIDTSIISLAYVDDMNNALSEVAISFIDPIDEENFYEVTISDISFHYDSLQSFYRLSSYDNIITSESYYPSLVRFDLRNPYSLLFNDKAINGKEHTLNVYYSPPQQELSGQRYIMNHYISIHLRNVTEEYYQYKTSLYQHLYNNTEDILYGMGEPLQVVTNIENGYGLFAGFNNDIVSMKIEEIPVQ